MVVNAAEIMERVSQGDAAVDRDSVAAALLKAARIEEDAFALELASRLGGLPVLEEVARPRFGGSGNRQRMQKKKRKKRGKGVVVAR